MYILTQIDERPERHTWGCEVAGRKCCGTIQNIGVGDAFLCKTPKAT